MIQEKKAVRKVRVYPSPILLLPGCLLRRAREYWHGLNLVNTATNGGRIMLPAHTSSVIYKSALAEWIGNASCLWSKRWILLLLVWKLLRLLLHRRLGGNAASKRVGARGLGLHGLSLERTCILAWRVRRPSKGVRGLAVEGWRARCWS